MSENLDSLLSGEDGSEKPRVELPHSWLHLAFGLLAVALVSCTTGILIKGYLGTRPVDLRDFSWETFALIEDSLQSHQISPNAILRSEPVVLTDRGATSVFASYDVELPSNLSAEGLKLILDRSLRTHEIRVVDWHSDDRRSGIGLSYADHLIALLRFTPGREPVVPIPVEPAPLRNVPLNPVDSQKPSALALVPETLPEIELLPPPPLATPARAASANRRPRMAIIVDDGGYGGRHTEAILDMDRNLTLSILPNTPFGRRIAERAGERGFEILLHMPMQNETDKLTYVDEITVDMSRAEISELTFSALEQVPGAIGVNNHTGSRFTRNPEALRRFLEAVEDTGLFFIDSRTTSETRGLEVARSMDILSAQRDLFLDHDDDVEMIRSRFEEAMGLAITQGQVIAICHFRPKSAKVLGEMLPKLYAAGIELVPVSELVR